MSDLAAYLKEKQRTVDAALRAFLPKPTTPPSSLHKAMHYSLFVGGKRLRPILCLAAAEAFGGAEERALPLACAVECLHTYSLIHDDLPSMDDDDLRRGKPTCHVVFGEALAVLAGDALQAFAFELVGRAAPAKRHGARDYLLELARAAGSLMLIAGQVMDVEAEGRPITKKQLAAIHERKTAALLAASLRLGAMSANAQPERLAAIGEFGQALGLAFQVIDDILDCTQSTATLGKSAGKDQAAQKATYPALLGLEKSRREAERLTAQANEALSRAGKNTRRLRELSDHLLKREF